jgi:Ca-activated chloride channel family protein
MKGRRLLSAAVMLALALLAGGKAPLAAAPQAARFTSAVETVRVDVLVTAAGRPVRGLQASDFEVFDNGARQNIDFAAFEQPLNVILALDMSASVAGARLTDLQRASRMVLDGLRAGDRAALVTFSHLVVLAADLTEHPARVGAVVDSLTGKGETALVDGAYAALILGEQAAGRSLVMVFSDGLDTSSWLTPDSVVGIAKQSDVVAYSVSTGGATPPFLRDLAQTTGGRSIDLSSTKALGDAFVGILGEFRGRYVLGFTPQRTGRDEGWHRLQVRVKGRNVSVKARPGYMAGSQ